MSILVAVGGAHAIVESGIRSVLAGDPSIEVMEHFPEGPVVPDVVLYDAIAVETDGGTELTKLVHDHASAFVVVARDLRPDLATLALACGADGVISIEASPGEILQVVRDAAAGELPAVDHVADGVPVQAAAIGITPRESDVLSLITQGKSNQDLADDLGVSINSVKSYIRSAYRKMDVTTRAQAISWCVRHGFEL